MALDEEEARSRVLALAAEVFGDDVWTDEYPARALSSVQLMRFVVRLEKHFEITVSDEDLASENLASLRAVVGLVQRSLGQGNA